MNLKVRTEYRSDYDPEGTVLELVNGLRLVAAVHPDFKEEVMFSVENEDYPTVVSIQIESLGVNWSVGMSHAFEDWTIVKSMPIDEACAKIKELTSPRVDQPAPARTAADVKLGEYVWHFWGGTKYISQVSFVHWGAIEVRFTSGEIYRRETYNFDKLNTQWGYAEGEPKMWYYQSDDQQHALIL